MVFPRNKNKVDKDNKELWYSLENDFKNLDGDEFEKLLGALYQRKGFKVIKTPKGPDYGVDLLVRKGKTTVIIQAKNWTGKVSSDDILKTAGARQMHNASYAMVITSSHFTESAKKAIKETPRIRGMEIEGVKRQIKEHFKKESRKPKKESFAEKIKSTITGKKKARPPVIRMRVREKKISRNQHPRKTNQMQNRRRNTRSKSNRSYKKRHY